MLNFALVGCGRISGKHASNLAEGRVKGARLVAVCDLIPEKAQKLATKYDVPWFTSLQDMMQAMSEKIDVVNVLTDSGSHCDVTLEVAKWRKHIVVEKPMAMTLEQADSMISACEEAGVKLFVVKQNRFNLPVIKLREALEAGRFGKLVMGTMRVRWCRTQDYYDQASWRGKWASDGGVFANQASH
ncbi:MAG: Gfo/Idh/MocA family oxidoreductase, partial [Bdellovibrionaceae bacterium]|nr:Gfo/Idh/MocA family oxidoreductase [Pseudobdellovibrionaceae bacterium]